MSEPITVSTSIHAPFEKVWDYYTKPTHVMGWNHASDDWHTTAAESDLKEGGKFSYRMEAKDGSEGFDFEGTYTKVNDHGMLEYTFDGRMVSVDMMPKGDHTEVVVKFDPEDENPIEQQQQGWQAILDNFKKYVEAN